MNEIATEKHRELVLTNSKAAFCLIPDPVGNPKKLYGMPRYI